MSLLERIDSPADLKGLSIEDLERVCAELRQYIIDVVTQIGGHFGSSLGAVELTVGLHYVFDTPRDRIVWDVGHQAYGHKVLTGRREALKRIRQAGGISGFPKRSSLFTTQGAPMSMSCILYQKDATLLADLLDLCCLRTDYSANVDQDDRLGVFGKAPFETLSVKTQVVGSITKYYLTAGHDIKRI